MTAMLPLVSLIRFGNDIEALANEVILPTAISRLRGQLSMTSHVTVNTDDVAEKVGAVLQLPRPIEFSEAQDHPKGQGSTSDDIEASVVDVKLDKHIYKQFSMTDEEYLRHAAQFTLPSAMEAAVDSIAVRINRELFDLYKDVPSISGNPASLAGRDKADLIALRKAFQARKVNSGVKLVMTGDTEADLLLEFSKLNETGDAGVIQQGLIGRKYGIDLYSDVQAPYHTAGTAAANAGMTLAAAASAGDTSLSLEGVAGATFVRGDVVKIAGSPQTFTVTADTTGSLIPVYPAVLVPIASGTAVEVLGDHNVDLAFTKSAFLIAFRQLKTPANAASTTIASMSDPLTGVTLRLLSWYDPSYESTQYKLETLFGLKAVAPERSIRFGGH
ncbi:hypothetical protein MYW52_25865 [Pseudomonas juntendi]|uniref:P22 phage major capsid protein family protein n=1 Tax=Pseudomonas juntendi TaxID=2666183 RepID=UPI001FFD5844|nr:P22 phage major capsid protein family protein [Pseudomonas juntendi]MCK2118902.1 hypothetical protein [Pseudomonas juntendi]